MEHPGPDLEIEIKLAVASADEARALLGKLRAGLESPRKFEDNAIFDFPEGPLRSARRLLRLRTVEGEGVVTFKEPVESDLHAKVRFEIESRVSSPVAVRAILLKLGLVTVYRYQKYRSYYAWAGGGKGAGLCISLDETPIGVFLELEGEKDSIDRAAAMMGKTQEDYILEDYRTLHAIWLEQRGLPPADMVFPGPEPGSP